MANTLTEVIPKLLAQGLLALRQQAVMPRLVNRSYDVQAAQQGATIDVPIPSAVTAVQVTPAATPPSTADQTPTSVPIALNQWWEAPFHLSDKDRLEVISGFLPMQASEAIKSLANNVDSYILGLYKTIYGYSGVAGTTPFASSLTEYTAARTALNNQLAPPQDRRVVLNPDAEGAALLLRAFQDAGFGGGAGVIQEGQIGRKVGADWWMDQNIPTHTAGTLTDATIHGGELDGLQTIGLKTLNMASTSLVGTVVPGDVFTVAGDTQTYAVTNTTTVTAAANAVTGVTFEPGAQVAWADNALITFKDTHAVNLNFHRDAFAFATRPLEALDIVGNGQVRAAVDPVSGMALRLEVTREHKRIRYSYDILYGAALVRRELATRIAG